ncbi:hypothetical protein Poli38472_007446 [Pythium oligandrum]|uniref:FYVE-type domain-containing protein n=1 Tax=Pythium oligandrum TaxID=41045 RepID=A0A8K1CR80_PYTOL|nr:hypothetical protein Poli38472_007446 [Pythium oligandrum]|eukprot:TMW67774.1 hypothetical protein Poli38472_007446 [Pythium oligandrum]
MDGATGAAKRMDAIKLAKGSKWEELRRLVDAEPLAAQQTDSYGMLPLHWACTEPHSISETVLMALLKAYPQGARVVNTAEMVPLQIAIKAQAKIEWLQALLASYPDAVMKKVPTGENAVELARKANLPRRSIRLLEEMYHHVCQKAGYSSEHLYSDDEHAVGGHEDMGPEKARMSGIRPVDTSESLQRYASTAETGSNMGSSAGRSSRRTSTSEALKGRTYSESDFVPPGPEALYRGVSTSSTGSGGNGNGPPGVPGAKPLPYQTSTKMSSRTVVSLPPRWTNAPNCHICSQKFGAFRKRHHCRNCGQSICSEHSARERMKLPHYGLPDKYRVCTVCFQTLRNANQDLLQPSQARLTMPSRRSDEVMPRPPSQVGANYQLERHVSAPARALMNNNGNGAPGYQGIHHQVASLQKQVSQLMEEKEMAETQLRTQAELLNEAYPVDRTPPLGRRDRLQSAPMLLPPASNAMTPPPSNPYSTSLDMTYPPPQYTNYQAPSYGGYDQQGQMVHYPPSQDYPPRGYGQTLPSASVDSVAPEPPTSNDAANHDTMAQLQEGMGNMSFMSSYSEFDDRSTGVFHDYEAGGMLEASGGIPQELLEEVDEQVDEIEDDEDDDGESALPEIEVLVNLGMSMLNKGSSSAAVQAFTRAVEICPDSGVLYSYLAKAHYADDNLDDALFYLDRSLALEPTAANYTLLGKILFEKGDHEKAIAAYQKSLEFQKPSP